VAEQTAEQHGVNSETGEFEGADEIKRLSDMFEAMNAAKAVAKPLKGQ
jgi:hypothetical protein